MSKIRKTIIKKLIEDAKKAMLNAYVPYSKLKVGAAVLTKKGNVYTGCNVESGSYGLTVCAERNAIMSAIMHGEKTFEVIVVITNSGLRTPCGLCRQVIYEFDKDIDIIMTDTKNNCEVTNIKELLPYAFEPNLKKTPFKCDTKRKT